MTRPNDKQRVVDHYERVSPYYHRLWGEHLHHGYWIRGDESKEAAQAQMVEHLAGAAGIAPGQRILDVGCGFGGSSIHLARRYGVEATGITISPVQVEMATRAAAEAQARAAFLLMDAEALTLEGPFDVIWSIESISHYQDVPAFFASAARLLPPGGTVALTDWFKRQPLSAAKHRELLSPIEDGMLVELHTLSDYRSYLSAAGLETVASEVLNDRCAKTWDFCLEIIKDRALWKLAAQNGADFLRFLRAFKAMRAGFSSGNFVYGLLVAKKAA